MIVEKYRLGGNWEVEKKWVEISIVFRPIYLELVTQSGECQSAMDVFTPSVYRSQKPTHTNVN